MIVESTNQRTIGEVFVLPRFEYGPTGDTRAKILREATEEEYIADCLADPSMAEECRHLMVIKRQPGRWWYEVATD